LEEINDLISLGAQPDHWVDDDGQLYNAIMNAIRQVSKDFRLTAPVTPILIANFPKFGNTDRGRISESPLGMSFHTMTNLNEVILATKTAINPIYTFLTQSPFQYVIGYLLKLGKLMFLQQVDELYNLSTLMQCDLEQVRKDGKINDEHVRANLQFLFWYCEKYKKDFLLKTFGKSYSIKTPLAWRFKKGKHFQ